MNKEVYENAIILYGEELEPVRGHLVVENGIIEKVGEGAYMGPKKDIKGGIICPCFTNSHVHLGDAAGRDMGAYLPIGERVGKTGVKYTIQKNPQTIEAIKKTLAFMKRSGTSAFSDFREGGRKGIDLVRGLLNMQARLLGRPVEDKDMDVFSYSDGFGISQVRDYSRALLDEILEQRGGGLVGVHAGEVRDDLMDALRIDPDFLVHLTNAGKDGLQKVIKKRIPIVLCPRANASFGVGFPPLKEILNGGTIVALGTDNVMANEPDMLREMEFTWKLYRGLYKDNSFDARIVLKMATLNGRNTLRMPPNSIEEGKKADFFITRKFEHAHDPILALVHRASSCDIKEVVTS